MCQSKHSKCRERVFNYQPLPIIQKAERKIFNLRGKSDKLNEIRSMREYTRWITVVWFCMNFMLQLCNHDLFSLIAHIANYPYNFVHECKRYVRKCLLFREIEREGELEDKRNT